MTLLTLSITDMGRALRRGQCTVVELVRAHLAAIDRLDPDIGAFVAVFAAQGLADAATADAELQAGQDRGPLHGIPFAIKDLIDVAGWPVRAGSRRLSDRIAPADAPVIARMRAAGAIPLGLVATYEHALVGPSSDSLYPAPRNPWDHAHITGGSSSGAAAAVAAGMVRLAIGTDTGGSVRSPSSYCGVVGLKPRYGLVPTTGVLPLSPSLDHIGPIARTVAEAALAFAVMAGQGSYDLSGGLTGLRLGYARAAFADDPQTLTQVTGAMDTAASALTLAGAQLRLIDLPDIADMEAAGAILIHAEALAVHRPHLTGTAPDYGRMAYQSLIAGVELTDVDVTLARQAAARYRAEIDAILTQVDAIILPTTLTTAPPFSAFAGGEAVWTPMRTLPFNVTGHPALSVPMGFAGRLPLGMQIVAGSEQMALRIGAAFESATDHSAQSPAYS